MSSQVEQAGRILAAFEKSKSIDSFFGAVEQMEGVNLMGLGDTKERLAARRAAARMWLKILAAIDEHLDPKFDPEDVPETKVVPPPSGRIQPPPGVSPEAITDPRARAEYEAALKKNAEKIASYNFQTKLQRLNKRASTSAKRFLTTYYTPVHADQQELLSLLREEHLSTVRQGQIKALFKAE